MPRRPRPTFACPVATRRCTTGARRRAERARRAVRPSGAARPVRAGRRGAARARGEPPHQRSGPRRDPPTARRGAARGCRARPRHRGLAVRRSRAQRFTVTLTHGSRDTTAGSVTLELPPGWPAVTPQPFSPRARTSVRRSCSMCGRPRRRGRGPHRWRGGAGQRRPALYDRPRRRWTTRTSGRGRWCGPSRRLSGWPRSSCRRLRGRLCARRGRPGPGGAGGGGLPLSCWTPLRSSAAICPASA